VSDLIIKIGDDPLDLSSGETIALTRQAAKVGDFVAVMADGTNEVTVPLTANNRAVLDNAHLIPTESILPYRRTEATMIQEGYETITNGYAIIKSSADNFSLQVVGGNGGFFDLIRNLNLRELSLSEYDHFWTNLHAFNNRNNTDGHIYAVFEQSDGVGVDSTMRTYGTNLYAVQTARLLPCFHVKDILPLLFGAQGYTFVTDLTGDDIYDRLVAFNGKPDRGVDMSYHQCTVRNVNQFTWAEEPLGWQGYLFPDATVDPVTNVYGSSSELLAALQAAVPSIDNRFPVTDNCTIDLTVTLIIDNVFGPALPLMVEITHTGTDGDVVILTDPQTVALGLGTYVFNISFDCLYSNNECKFGVRIEYVTPSLQPIEIMPDSTYTINSATLISNAPIQALFPFNYMTGPALVPDMKQSDFLKDLSKTFQWIYDVNEITKVVTARRYDSVIDNLPSAIDLSDRIDTRKQKITYGIDGFAQTNSLAYKPDDITGYDAIGYIDVDDQTLKAESKYVEVSQFAATSTRKRFDTVDAPYVPIFDDEALPSNGVAHRLLLLERVTFPYNVNFNRAGDTPADYPTDDLTFAYFAKAGNPTSLDFPNLITRFYQTIMAMSLRGKTLECLMNLKISDVVNYNPFTPVYIQQHGSYFYWQKVSNYVKDKLTKCTFIRL
jgi:hypothetical protein